METKTYRGLSLAEVEAKVRAELGDDAVVVRQREGLTGGVGGFFQRRIYEVEAIAGNGIPAPAPAPAAGAAAAPKAAPAPVAPQPVSQPEDFAAQLKAALAPEPEQAAAEQRAAQAAAVEFIPDALAASAKVEAAVSEPRSDLAALFAPDVPKPEIAWPDEEPVAVATALAPLGEPEILPAPVARPAAAAVAAVPAHWPVGAARLQAKRADRGLSDGLVADVVDEAVTHLLPFASQKRIKPLVASAL